MATATPKPLTSLKLACPFCGTEDPAIVLKLNDLPECECQECSETFTPAEAAARFAAMAERWARVGAWIAAAPDLD